MVRPCSCSVHSGERLGTNGVVVGDGPAMFKEARGKGELVRGNDRGDGINWAEQHVDACQPTSRPSLNQLEVGIQAEHDEEGTIVKHKSSACGEGLCLTVGDRLRWGLHTCCLNEVHLDAAHRGGSWGLVLCITWMSSQHSLVTSWKRRCTSCSHRASL